MNSTDYLKFLKYNNLNNVYEITKSYAQKYGEPYALGMIGEPIKPKKTAYDLITQNINITDSLNYNSQSWSQLWDNRTLELYKSYAYKPNFSEDNKLLKGTNYFILCTNIEETFIPNDPDDPDIMMSMFTNNVSLLLTTNEYLEWENGLSSYEIYTEGQYVNKLYYPTCENYGDQNEIINIEGFNYIRTMDSPWTQQSPTKLSFPLFSSIQYQQNIEYIPEDEPIIRSLKLIIFGDAIKNQLSFACLDYLNNFYEGIMGIRVPYSLYKLHFNIGYVCTDYNIQVRFMSTNLEVSLHKYNTYKTTETDNWLKKISI